MNASILLCSWVFLVTYLQAPSPEDWPQRVKSHEDIQFLILYLKDHEDEIHQQMTKLLMRQLDDFDSEDEALQ